MSYKSYNAETLVKLVSALDKALDDDWATAFTPISRTAQELVYYLKYDRELSEERKALREKVTPPKV